MQFSNCLIDLLLLQLFIDLPIMNWKKIAWRQKIDSMSLPFEVCRLSEAILCPANENNLVSTCLLIYHALISNIQVETTLYWLLFFSKHKFMTHLKSFAYF